MPATKMTATSKLSVVIANYNHGPLLVRSISAILAQSFQPSEIIVIDDGSMDQSVEIIQGLAAKYPIIRLYRNGINRGIDFVVKQSLEIVTGDYVYWAGADDIVLPDLFKQSMDLLSQNPRAGLCSALTYVFDDNGQDRGIYPSPMISASPCYISPERSAKVLTTLGSWFTGNTAIFRRTAVMDEGGFPEGLHALIDAFLSQILALRHGACFIPEPLGRWRRTPTTYSSAYGANAEIQYETLERAAALMRSERYRHLFPERFISIWKNEMRFGIAMTSHKALEVSQREFLNRYARTGEPSGPMDWVARSLVSAFLWLASFAVSGVILVHNFPRLALMRRLYRISPPQLREHLWRL